MDNRDRTPLDAFLARNQLTQTELAERSGLALSHVNGIVRGHFRPRTDTAARLLTCLRQLEPEITFEDIFPAA